MLTKLEEMHAIKDRIVNIVHTMAEGDISKINTAELGMAVDMIKDMCEAEEKCWKACYYQQICMAMDEEHGDGRLGYDHWRYSSGRFAPTGHGHLSGYPSMSKHMSDPAIHRMGFHEDGRDMGETLMSIKETMHTADPEMKRKLKADLANLLAEMN